jgi:hypothetical protein
MNAFGEGLFGKMKLGLACLCFAAGSAHADQGLDQMMDQLLAQFADKVGKPDPSGIVLLDVVRQGRVFQTDFRIESAERVAWFEAQSAGQQAELEAGVVQNICRAALVGKSIGQGMIFESSFFGPDDVLIHFMRVDTC